MWKIEKSLVGKSYERLKHVRKKRKYIVTLETQIFEFDDRSLQTKLIIYWLLQTKLNSYKSKEVYEKNFKTI